MEQHGRISEERLYLNLLADADPDELGLRYDLRFRTDDEAKAATGEPDGHLMRQADAWLQFGLQFTPVRRSSREYAHAI